MLHRSVWCLASVSVFVALSACSGKVIEGTPSGSGSGPEAGGAGGAQGVETGGASSGGRVGTAGRVGSGGRVGAGGILIGPGGSSVGGFASTGGAGGSVCDSYESDVEKAVSSAGAFDGACAKDDDCVYGTLPSCMPSCGQPIVSKAGAKQLQSVVAMTAPGCALWKQAGCVPIPLPCPAQLGVPACVSNHCTNGVPSDWDSLTFIESPTFDPNVCTGTQCTRYTVTPNGFITFSQSGSPKCRRLNPSQLKTFDTIARKESFRESFFLGFQCPAVMSVSFMTVERKLGQGETYSENVTGCIFGVPMQSDVLTLWGLVETAGSCVVDAGTGIDAGIDTD